MNECDEKKERDWKTILLAVKQPCRIVSIVIANIKKKQLVDNQLKVVVK